MTEDEAKTKWCPHARTLVTLEVTATKNPIAAASANRFSGDAPGQEKGSLCVASGCMAWRERSTGHMTPVLGGGRQHTATKDGYCGLAGAPS